MGYITMQEAEQDDHPMSEGEQYSVVGTTSISNPLSMSRTQMDSPPTKRTATCPGWR